MIVTEGEIRVRFLNNNQLEFIDYMGKSLDPFSILDDLAFGKKKLKWDDRTSSYNEVNGKVYLTSVGYTIKWSFHAVRLGDNMFTEKMYKALRRDHQGKNDTITQLLDEIDRLNSYSVALEKRIDNLVFDINHYQVLEDLRIEGEGLIDTLWNQAFMDYKLGK